MKEKRSRIRVFLASVLISTIHLVSWFIIWGFVPMPSVATTSRVGETPFGEQYWIIILSLALPTGVFLGWTRPLIFALLLAVTLVWILRFGFAFNYGY